MCELFGISAREPVRANDWLQTFYSHSDEHPDGWGLAVFRKGSVTMEKEPVKASESRYLKQRLSRNIEGKELFAHIRKATIGQIEYANCHPFIWDDETGRTWTLIHNGTLFDASLVQPYRSRQEGSTDSERALLYILDSIDRRTEEQGRELDADERFRLVDELVMKLAPKNKLNFMLHDGEQMYIHTNCRETLFYMREGSTILVATRPLSRKNWQQFPMCRLLAFRDGRQTAAGTMHGYEYVENEHDLISLYAAFAEL